MYYQSEKGLKVGKRFCWALLILFCSVANAVDSSRCVDWINNQDDVKGVFSIDKTGHIKPIGKATLNPQGDNDVVRDANGFNYTLRRNPDGSLASLTLPSLAEVKFEKIKNQCVPTAQYTVGVTNNGAPTSLITSTKLCRDLDSFFKNNPVAKQCLESNAYKQAETIMSGALHDTGLKGWDDSYYGYPEAGPIFKAGMIVKQCERDHLKSFYGDDTLWTGDGSPKASPSITGAAR